MKIGIGIAQTGTLGGGGKAALLALQMWVEDVNAKGGLLGRKVELIAYDDQSSASTTPGIYTKLLDVDKVDLLIAPYGTVPTAAIMPLVKQRSLLLMGNFSFQVNHVVKHDMWFNNAPWGDATSWTEGFLKVGAGGRREDHRLHRIRPGVRAEPRERREGNREEAGSARPSTSRTIRPRPWTSPR